MVHRIFISYRNSDGKHFANNIYETLKKCGFQPFYSEREFRGGDEFPTELEEKVQNCDVFILALTPGVYSGFLDHPREKDYVFQEIKTALRYNKVIIPFKDGETISFSESDFPQELNNIQTIDGRIRKIGDQHALVYHNDLEDPFRQLVKDVKKHVTKKKHNKYSLSIPMSLLVIVALLAGLFLWQPWRGQTFNDTTPPTLVISNIEGVIDGKVQAGQSISFTVTSMDNTSVQTIMLSENMIILPPGLSAQIQVSGEGNVRTVTLNEINGANGDYTVTIAANAAQDAAGNQSAEVQTSFVMDSTIPTLVMTKPVVENGTVTIRVYADDETALSSFFVQLSDITTIGFIADTIEITGTGSMREIKLSDLTITSGEACRITIGAGVAVDSNGNKSKEITSGTFQLN